MRGSVPVHTGKLIQCPPVGQPPAFPVNTHRIGGPTKTLPWVWTVAGARFDEKTGANWKEFKTIEEGTQATCLRFSHPPCPTRREQDARGPRRQRRRRSLGQDTVRHAPRMQFDLEPVNLDHRISGTELLSFLQ